MEIKNVIICGLGALGVTYANKFKDVCNLKILADEERITRYKKNPPKLNGVSVNLDYILPSDRWNADLIIIATKAGGLESAVEYIKNFVNSETIIISLINGISSEERIASVYGKDKVLRSYFIGHSAVKFDNNVTQDGVGKIVIESDSRLEEFFRKNNIGFEVSDDIIYSQWLKLGVNIILNEPSAIYEMTVGGLRKVEGYQTLARNLLSEVKTVAQKHGVRNLNDYEEKVLEAANLVADDGTTSMFQDILAGRKTEVDIFSGEIIRLGKIYGVSTPYNNEIYRQIKKKESV